MRQFQSEIASADDQGVRPHADAHPGARPDARPDARPARRATDSRALLAVVRHASGWPESRDGVSAGRALLLASGTVVVLTAPLLHPDRAGWLALTAVSATLVLVLLLSRALPWSRLPGHCSAVFPALVGAALAVLSQVDHGLAAPYVGLFVLCFACTGLTQPATTSLALVPLFALAWVLAMDDWSAALAVRLVIACSIWLLLSQLLAGLTAQQRSLTAALRTAALTDPLTGLANRRDLDSRLLTLQAGDSVALLDLDHFKHLNDTLGHAAGDQVLAEFGQLLRTCLREQDYTARYGGEEFAVLLPATSPSQAHTSIARLRRHWALLQPTITFSAGVAACPPPALIPADAATGTARTETVGSAVLAAADHALYAAKAAGRDRTVTGSARQAMPSGPS